MDKSISARGILAPIIIAISLGAFMTAPAGAEFYDDVVPPTFTIKFQKGNFTPINYDDIQEAALWAKSEGKMLQVEGFSCADDGKVEGKPTHRVDQADKRAVAVMNLLIQFGAPPAQVYTLSYEHGACAAVITVLSAQED